MKIYKGEKEAPFYSSSLQRLQVVWFVMIGFLLFLLEQGKQSGWLEKPEHQLGFPPGVWPIPSPYKLPILDLEEANLRLLGPGPEGYGEKTLQPGQISHVLRFIDCWNNAVENNLKDEARAIAQCAGALIRYNWNLVNSAGLHLTRLSGGKYFSNLEWREKAAPAAAKPKTSTKSTKPKKKAVQGKK